MKGTDVFLGALPSGVIHQGKWVRREARAGPQDCLFFWLFPRCCF